MEEINEQTEITANTAGAEENQVASENTVSLGKFKDVNSLLNAYNSLQSEFTKRCQRIKELESASSGETEVPEKAKDGIQNEQGKTLLKEEILKEYLKGVLESKPKAILMTEGGAGAKTPSEKPKSISEAGALFKQTLK